MGVDTIDFQVEDTSVRVSGLLLKPESSLWLYVLAHGAGAGMRHPFLEDIAQGLAGQGVATFRYQFPYMEQGRRRPDPPHLLMATVRSAVNCAANLAPDIPLLAGGKSLGGRMTSSASAKEPLVGVRGLVFLGFPLHAPGKPGDERATHLFDVDLRMLFLQGTRDTFARLDLLGPVCRRLGARASMHVVEGGDHSFKVQKRSGRTMEEVMAELISAISDWAAALA